MRRHESAHLDFQVKRRNAKATQTEGANRDAFRIEQPLDEIMREAGRAVGGGGDRAFKLSMVEQVIDLRRRAAPKRHSPGALPVVSNDP
jgi:hypothetical protein